MVDGAGRTVKRTYCVIYRHNSSPNTRRWYYV